ncbi:glycosyltransferase [Anabaena subtropica]|uniref:Glycosyltransferase n=1 Tax=Anabaena subtropica FACHB-260 TaxID=2692884 RepID=A0ABR8CSE9_9NOST|nr:glycosyltransferase [Anabaena subtropica]MBD2346117.1 glycosyltransferase [Anabaena subtropica FACHB-260]
MNMPKILLTNHHLINYAGSELVTLDLATEFQQKGWDVVVATFRLGGAIKEDFKERDIEVVNVLHQSLSQTEFDLVWSHHYPVLIKCLVEDGIKTKSLIISSLSPYEPLEAIPFLHSQADLILCNSEETKKEIIKETSYINFDKSKLFVFKNSVPSNWFDINLSKKNTGLSKIAIISNHPPQEILDTIDILKSREIEVDLIGISANAKLVNIDLLSLYDAVITIGRTVQHSMALGIPAFCYDHFGGPGWLTPENFQIAEWFNYSGRCCYQKLTSEQIVDKLINEFVESKKNVSFFQSYAINNYSLTKNIDTVLTYVTGRGEEDYISFNSETVIGKVGKVYRHILGERENLQHELERSHSQIQQTQVELERSHSQLQQTQTELERSHSQLQHLQKEVDFLQIALRIQFWNNPFIKIITQPFKFHEISPTGYLQGYLEAPILQESSVNTLLVSGWLFSTGVKIQSLVLVKHDLSEEEIQYELSRPDVSQAYPDIENAGSSGFTHTLILDNQYSLYTDIQIWAILETGERICCFARRVNFLHLKMNSRIKFFKNLLEKNIAKLSSFNEISPNGYLQGYLEAPSPQESSINGTLFISGWLFSTEAKIQSLVVLKDNSSEEQIEYGLSRSDVSLAYPDVENAVSSGFTHNLILNNQNSRHINIQIWAILETGERICCFTRRVKFKPESRERKLDRQRNKVNLFLFVRGVVTKAITAYKQGRLPLAPTLWIYYLRRYYRQSQYLQNYQNIGIQYSGIIHPWQIQDPYQRWLQTNALSSNLLTRMKEDAEKLAPQGVKISVVVPVYNTPENFLTEMIDSVRSQIYTNWELCIADDASTKAHVREILQQIMAEDSRIKVVFRPNNGHIVEATNSALEIATGDFIALLDHDDTLSCDALLHVAECVNQHPEVDWIYTDEDKINESGYHFDPQMKGAWSPEMAITHNFTHHLTVIRKTLIDQVGGMRKGFQGAQDLDLFLRVSEKTTPDKIHHIPHVCYHWRTHAGSTASHGTQKQYVFDSAYNAIEAAIQRRGLKATTFLPPIAKQYGLCLHQLKWDDSLIAENPVTIVIPTKDRVDLLKKCVSSLEKTVNKRFVKLLIIDDGSTEQATHKYFDKLQQNGILECRVINSERKIDVFNYARLMNLACEHIDTPYVLHLNNDIQALEPGWLEDMVGWMSIDGVGVVGAKLLYPDQTIQHAGVVVGPHNGLADHLFHHLHKEEVGYICLPHAARNVSAVTGACLLTSTNLYRELGGFDEENFAVEYNDVDYCLRVLQSGKRVVYSPQSILIHETSASRGKSYNPQEHIDFLEKYQNFVDPFFSRKLDINSMVMAINPYSYSHLDRISTAKILFITHNLNLEGAPLIVYNYARYFASQGSCEICVISSKDGILRQKYEELNIPVKIIQETLPLHNESLEKYRQRLREFGENLNLASYDLVVCNTLLSFWGIEMARFFKSPTIWHIHESQNIDMSIDSFFSHASKEIIQKILPDCFTNATRVVFQAEATRRIFHQFDTKGNFRTISGGIDLEKIKDFRNTHSKYQLREKYGINQEHLVISIVGTTCQRKGQHIFIEAIKELEKLCGDKFANISCLIVGARKDSYLDLLNRQIQTLELKNITIQFETQDVYDFYALSDIFVCASFEESFPRVLLEAMAFELKIISTDVFGIPEIIEDGGQGYLVQPGNPKALAVAIYQSIVEPTVSERMAKNGYARLHRMFDNKNLLQQHWLLAKEVILSQPYTK